MAILGVYSNDWLTGSAAPALYTLLLCVRFLSISFFPILDRFFY